MAELNISKVVEQSVQSTPSQGASILGGFLMTVNQLSGVVPGWWSTARDRALAKFVKSSDHMSGAIYNMQAKMKTIPIKVVAKDKSIRTHVDLAQTFTDVLLNSQFGAGWPKFFEMFLEDLLTQDNGAFAEVIGYGRKDGPIEGIPLGVAHLDAARCTRTGDIEYPVVYSNTDGRLYKLHYSRVLYMSQMTSTRAEMYGVGFCAVSRAINAAQNLLDISIYKQEKLGSRPTRQILLTKGGLDPDDVINAQSMADAQNLASGLARYSKTLVMGSRVITDPGIDQIDLAKVPDGYNEHESTILGMAVIAMALGMDANDLFPAMQENASKANAIIQHIKQRGKGPGEILQSMELALNLKFCPPYLAVQFDYQDDAQDRQAAEIRNIRAQGRERDLKNGVTQPRVEREIMLDNGEITEGQFEALELEDGRLEDGVTVDVLFHDKDKDYVQLLSGVTAENFEDKIQDIMAIIINSKDANLIRKARRAIAAIKYKFVTLAEQKLSKDVKKFQQMSIFDNQDQQNGPNPTGKRRSSPTTGMGSDQSYQGERFGRKLPRQLVNAPNEEQNYQG